MAKAEKTDKFVDQTLGCHCRGGIINDATHTATTFAVYRLGFFLYGFQHSDPGISHVPY